MVPIIVVLICVGWRVLQRRKADEQEEADFLTVKSRPIDPDESVKINSDDESIPYKKDVAEDSPVPTEPVNIVDNAEPAFTYGQPYEQQPQESQARQWGGETEIN